MSVQNRLKSRYRVAIVLALFVVMKGMAVDAEILPTQGTFRGIYHVNRAGVGRFSFFIIREVLKDQMAPYEGKYIELEVLKARQPINPGPAIVDRIGKVTRLPDPPMGITLRASSPAKDGGNTIDLICAIENVSEAEVIFNAGDLQVGVRGYSQPMQDDGPDQIFQTGYTRRQLSFGGPLPQPWNFISPMNPGERTHFYTGEVLLRPGEAAPFVVHGVELPPGQHEMTAIAAFNRSRDERVPVMAAQALEIPLAEREETPGGLLEARAQVTYEDEWLAVEGHILGKSDAGVPFFTIPDGQYHFLPGLIQLYSGTGELLPARLDWRKPDGPWKQTRVDREGLPFRFRVRYSDHFSGTSIKGIGLWTITQRGVEKLTLADHLPEVPHPPLPPWGQTVRGCRLRIRMPRESLDAGEKIRFFFQADSDREEADMVWINEGSFESHVVVTVDGKKARIGTTQISDGHVNFFPFQGEISLASVYKVPPGEHTLQLSVRGDPGTYKNLRGEEFRKFKGRLLSNVVEFEVKKKE